MGLFVSLSARNDLGGVAVPAEEFCESRRAEPQASQRRWILECDFAMLLLCPAQRRRAMREGSALLMPHAPAAATANNRCMARRTIRLFAGFDRRHDDFRGDKPLLSPLCPLSNQ
jgi:hypothetical protein